MTLLFPLCLITLVASAWSHAAVTFPKPRNSGDGALHVSFCIIKT